MSENIGDKKEIKFIVAPEWSEILGDVLQILRKISPLVGESKFTYVDEQDSNRAKVETKLGKNETLTVSCLGKNEINNYLVFKLFISTSDASSQVHQQNVDLNIELDKDGKIIRSLVSNKLKSSLSQLITEYQDKLFGSNPDEKEESSGTES